MPLIAIVDSGVLIATANDADPTHVACRQLLENAEFHLVIPALCVAEVAFVLHKRRGASAETQFLRGLSDLDVRAPAAVDWERVADLVERYSDLPLGATDATVVVLAERLETDTVFTLDRRHFAIVRPSHCKRLRLLPAG